jgi:FixJ family two-component response regulator
MRRSSPARIVPFEKEVLDLVVAGLLNKQIADELGAKRSVLNNCA